MTKWCLCGLAETVHLPPPSPTPSPPRWLTAQIGIRAGGLAPLWNALLSPATAISSPNAPPQPRESFSQPSRGYCHIGWWITLPEQLVVNVLLSSTVREHFQDLPLPHPLKRHFYLPFSASSLSRAAYPLLQDQRTSTPNCTQIISVCIFIWITSSLLPYYCHI